MFSKDKINKYGWVLNYRDRFILKMVLELWPCSNVFICTEECAWQHPEKDARLYTAIFSHGCSQNPCFLGIWSVCWFYVNEIQSSRWRYRAYRSRRNRITARRSKHLRGLIQGPRPRDFDYKAPATVCNITLSSDITILSFISPKSATSTANSSTEPRPRTTTKIGSNI